MSWSTNTGGELGSEAQQEGHQAQSGDGGTRVDSSSKEGARSDQHGFEQELESEIMDAEVEVKKTYGNVPCCICGASIQPNKTYMCVDCLKLRVDITEGIAKEGLIHMCKNCGKFSIHESRWYRCELESPELLAMCLKAIHGLGKGKKDSARLVDASWVWTEPHSRRLKVKLHIEKEVMNGALLRQRMVTEFIVKTKMCPDCAKETTDQQWNTKVQIRQRVAHKRTLLHLEQLLMKEQATKGAIDIVPVDFGMDFYFTNKVQAEKLSDVVMSKVPARKKESKSHQGTDVRNNKVNYKFSIAIEVVPICKDDVVILPTKLQNEMFGGSCAVALCESVSRNLHFIDPRTLDFAVLGENKYWANQFHPIASARDFIEFSVLDVQLQRNSPSTLQHNYALASQAGQNLDKDHEQEILGPGTTTMDASASSKHKKKKKKAEGPIERGSMAGQYVLAEVEVARASDLGVNDERFTVMSHLGHLLHPGDAVLGYDFSNVNFPQDLLAPLKGRDMPSIILVKKGKKS